jgi:trigger factor
MMGELAEQNRTYETKTGKSVKAADGDMVVADFVGRVDGVAFQGGSAEDAQIVIGSNQFIPGFEEQLIGAAAGDTVTVKVTFPVDYGVDDLKGKAAEFEVTLKDIRAAVKTTLDDAFAEKMGLGSLDALKAAVRGQIEQRYGNQSRFKLKRALLDALDAQHDFPLPPRMVDAEFEVIWSQIENDKAQGNLPPEDAEKSDDELKGEYRKIAERRVRLGLVLAEIGRKHNVNVSEQEMTEAARQEAMRYGPQAQQVFDYLRQTPQAQAQLRAPIYEDKVVDLIFGLAKVKDEAVSKDVLLQDDDLPESYGGEAAKKPAAKKAKAEAKPKTEAKAAKEEAPATAKAPAKPKAPKAKKTEA